MVYIPGGGGRDDFQRLGLGPLLEPHIAVLPFEVPAGPDGGPGSLCVFDNPIFPSDTPHVYDAGSQTWMEAPPDPDGDLQLGRYWVGYVTIDPPSPAELQRSLFFPDESVRLEGNRVWYVPIADFLPHRVTRDRITGREISMPKAEHAEFSDLANATHELLLGDEFRRKLTENRIVIPNGFRLASLALIKNYRVNVDVIDLLALLDDRSIVEVALAVTGVSLIARVEEQKKNAGTQCRPRELS